MNKKLLAILSLLTFYQCSFAIFNPIEDMKHATENETQAPSFDELFAQGNRLFYEQKYSEALLFYKQALELNPSCAHTHFNTGQALYHTKQYSLALEEFKQTLFLQPHHFYAYRQIGQLLYDVRQYSDAIIPLKRAILLNPSDNEAKLLLARVYVQLRKHDKALKILEKALSITPDDVNLRFEKASIYTIVNRYQEALAIYKQLDSEHPNNPSITYNIGYTLKKLGFVAQALEYYEKTLALNPNHPDAQFGRGLAYLVLGDFERGWEGYEWRYYRPDQGSLRSFTTSRWDGSDLNNKTILIHAEQGLGDTFQFIRYAQLLKERYPTVTIIVAVQKPLVSLLTLCTYIDTVVNINDPLPPFDTQASFMSLPYLMQTRLETVPAQIPYLFADEQLVQEWQEKLSSDKKFKIGICWQGNDSYATSALQMAVALKSIHVRQFAPIASVEGVTLYSLQKMAGTEQLNELPEGMEVTIFEGDFDNSHGRFMDTAAVMKNFDLIITVDTSICHLASALGVPTWVILPNPADWRWMINRTDSPWYPHVMRLFKQPTPGDWDTVIAEVAQELKKYINEQE